MLVKPTDADDVEAYLNKRLNQAIDNGYRTCKMWVKTASDSEAQRLLKEAGYKFEVVKTEEHSKQYYISW